MCSNEYLLALPDLEYGVQGVDASVIADGASDGLAVKVPSPFQRNAFDERGQ